MKSYPRDGETWSTLASLETGRARDHGTGFHLMNQEIGQPQTAARPLRILVTNIALAGRSGTQTLVRDHVLALRRRGHSVVTYSPTIGRAAAEIRATGSPVVAALAAIGEPPDIIHGHHNGPTMAALTRFPGTPAIFVCHDFSSEHDDPPLHPRIRRYFYVRHTLRGRLVNERGIDPELTHFWGNTIDLKRIGAARPPPQVLRNAAIFAHHGAIPFASELREACERNGVAFRGELLGKSTDDPVRLLDGIDLVFASGRMAMEAIAAGRAVINADRFGVAGMITVKRLPEFIKANFAMGALSDHPAAGRIDEDLAGYSVSDCASVTDYIRRECNSHVGAERIERAYLEVLEEQTGDRRVASAEDMAVSDFIEMFLQKGRIYDRNALKIRRGMGMMEDLHAAIDNLAASNLAMSDEIRKLRRKGFWRGLQGLVRRQSTDL
jgi:hypothetical protein